MGSLNDEIENLKVDKKKLRALVDEGQAQIRSKDEEITNLEREVKSLLQVELQNHFVRLQQATWLVRQEVSRRPNRFPKDCLETQTDN